MIPQPYQEILSEEKIIRTFSSQTEDTELIWHFDLEDRKIKVIQAGGWSFQRDNLIPQKLFDGLEFFIKKGEWHRILAGEKNLIIEIEIQK